MTVQQKIASASTTPQRYRYTRRDYLVLGESGAFRDYAKTELIEGVIYAANAQYSRHAKVHAALFRLLGSACERIDGGLVTWIEVSIDLPDGSMPQPDIMIAREPPDDGPVPANRTLLVIEISDSSIDFDLTEKARLYAGNGIPEYWVADVNARVIHQLWSPQDGAYAERREMAFGEALAAQTVAGLRIATAKF